MADAPGQDLQSWLPYWEAWKCCSQRPSDERRGHWDGMLEIFKSLAGQPDTTSDPIALAAISLMRKQWLEELQVSDNWNAGMNSLRLHRGITDGSAIAMRRALRAGAGRVRQFWPVSYSTDLAAALGFASKGHISGLVYSLNVPLSSVLLSDLTGYFRGGNSHKEMEIVVWHQQPVSIGMDDIPRLNVPARKPLLGSKAAKEDWLRETARLEEEERSEALNAGDTFD
jgi:hypothetical protein